MFLINYEFAKLFLTELNTIYTTSDNFIHKIIPLKYNILNFQSTHFLLASIRMEVNLINLIQQFLQVKANMISITI